MKDQPRNAIIKFARHIARKATSRNVAACEGGANSAAQAMPETEAAITKEENTLHHIGRISLGITWVIVVAFQFNSFRQAITIPGMLILTVISVVSAVIHVSTHSRFIRLSLKRSKSRQS